MPHFSVSRRHVLGAMGAALAAGPGSAAVEVPVPKGKVRAVLDTDTFNEIDDQYAVSYAMLSPEALRLEAIYAAPFLNARSTGPGDGMEKSYREIHRVLRKLHRESFRPVYRGSRSFLKAAGQPVDSPAARDLVQKALGSRELLYVLTTGAPTNVASAILMEPRIKDRICVVWLGGQPYDFPSAREFNLEQDPHASRVLFDSGVRLMNIPTTNVSEQLRTTLPELQKFLEGTSEIADYLYQIFIDHAREHHRDFSKPWSKVIWDIATVAWVIHPEWIQSKMTPSPILTEALTWKTDPSRHPVRVATHVDRDGIYADLVAKLAAA